MKHIPKFIFSLLFALSFSAFAQEQQADTVAVPDVPQRYGLRVGADLSRLARSFYDEDFRGIELVADCRLSKKIYAATELGNVDFTRNDEQVNFTTNGSYLKVGFDYNAYDNWLDMENMIYIGFRYGIATFSQNLNSYKIYQNSNVAPPSTDPNIPDPGNYLEEVTVQANREYTGLTAHWVEVVGGVKAKLFNNFFLGFSVRLNNLIADKKPADFDNLYIPGFNQTYDGSFGVGFNYSLSYFIPLYKKNQTVQPEQQQ